MQDSIGAALRCAGLALALASIGAGARAAPITEQSASSQVDAEGTTQVRDDDSTVDGFTSTQAVWPAGMDLPQARTAARSGAAEIAVNARVFSDTFQGRLFDLALSQAFYSITLDPVLSPTRANLEFFLPPSYLEIVNNAEIYFDELRTVFFADLRVCQTASCSADDQVFLVQADLEGTYRDLEHSVQAVGHPSLDLTPLLEPTVTDTIAFLRTYLVEFPEFVGALDLGTFAAGLPIRVEYTLQARASGFARSSSAIAAINDPFLLDTDPVQAGAPFSVTLVAVPEPGTAILCAIGVACLGAAGRRATRPTRESADAQ